MYQTAASEILDVIHTYSQSFGPMMYTWLGTYPVLLITEPDIIRDILTSPYCTNKGLLYEPLIKGIGRGLITSKEPEWSVHRKLLNPAFSFKILQSFMPIFNQEVNNIITILNKNNECSNMTTLMQDHTLNVAIRTTFGLNVTGDGKNGQNNCLKQNYQCRKLNLDKSLTPREPKNLNIFLDQAIELMRKNEFTVQQVEDELNTILLAAFETTANTITYTLMLLAMFPEYQEKVYKELRSLFPHAGDFEVTYENTQDMIYMGMVINESMRVLPPVPFVARENSHEIELTNGIVIPAGVQFGLNIFTMHRRKDLWGANADIFDPDNFLPSNTEGRHPYAFIPFTKGMRNCIGWKYGLLSTKVALAKLLMNFKFSTDFKYVDLQFYNSIVLELKQTPVLKIERR
ncbi:probable cytochrome P450 313a4 [Musca vetustissima]|uniref:probable cytochrome P450 313a4 n=1 Tax=Musca vetustissima TaxID=27455 RepID=UPI002AB746A8|nr:probable cytochrome P450 313a4 [Musca vetustissima]